LQLIGFFRVDEDFNIPERGVDEGINLPERGVDEDINHPGVSTF